MSWIKVKDGLPENIETVLAWTVQGYMLVWYSSTHQQWHMDDNDLPLVDGFVVAWQRIEEYNWEDDE